MSPEGIERLLKGVQAGRVTVEDAVQRLRTLPFEDLGFASLDHHRSLRQGFPEVLLCEGKTAKQSVAIARSLIKKGGPFLATRVEPAIAKAILKLDRRARYHADARIVAIDGKPARRAGHILVLTAGTADVPVAEEARVTAEVMGSHVASVSATGRRAAQSAIWLPVVPRAACGRTLTGTIARRFMSRWRLREMPRCSRIMISVNTRSA